MTKKQNVYSAAELKELSGDNQNFAKIKDFLGQRVVITSAVERESEEYGTFLSLTLEAKNETYLVAVSLTSPIGKMAIAAAEARKFPFAGKVGTGKSKKYKKAYYFLT